MKRFELKDGQYPQEITLPSKLVSELKKHYQTNELNDAYILADCICRYKPSKRKEYKQLCSSYMKLLLPDPRNSILRDMVKNEIIQPRINNDGTTFKINGECKNYRIDPDLLNWKKETVIVHHCLKRKPIERNTILSLRKVEFEFPEGLTVEEFVHSIKDDIKNRISSKVEIDYTMKTMKYDSKDRITNKNGKLTLTEFETKIAQELERLTTQASDSYINSVTKITNGKIKIPRIHQTNHRLNSEITNLPSLLLQYAKIEGESIVEFDLANSQYCLLANIEYSGAN